MRLEDRMFRNSTTERVIENASYPKWHLDKAHAMYELAIRAMSDTSLLPIAWQCFGREIEYGIRQGPPLGQPAAALLIDSKLPKVERTMVEALNEWSARQQEHFLIGLFERAERRAVMDRLEGTFGFKSKVTLNDADVPIPIQ
jgi:hypothetical protein